MWGWQGAIGVGGCRPAGWRFSKTNWPILENCITSSSKKRGRAPKKPRSCFCPNNGQFSKYVECPEYILFYTDRLFLLGPGHHIMSVSKSHRNQLDPSVKAIRFSFIGSGGLKKALLFLLVGLLTIASGKYSTYGLCSSAVCTYNFERLHIGQTLFGHQTKKQ